MALYHHQDNRS